MKPVTEWKKEKFDEIVAERKALIEQAPVTPTVEDPVNLLAKRLHPARQYMKVAGVYTADEDTKVFTLVPDPARGTDYCAQFMAGQYLKVYLEISGTKFNWPFSIASSPKDAFEGCYQLIVTAGEGGLAARYILDTWKEGDEVEVSGPSGHFCYQPIRDAETVICLAEKSGIAPFRSLARAIVDGDEELNLVIMYSGRTCADILCKEEFDRLAENEHAKVVYVLSDEAAEGCEQGTVSADLIRKYAPANEPYSVFVCGSPSMCQTVDQEIDKLGLERKYVRHELFRESLSALTLEDYPGTDQESVKITVTVRDTTRTVTGSANDTVLQILEKNGIAVPTGCRSGECGFCHSKLVSGEVYVPKKLDGRRLADYKFGFIHPCVTFPLTDIEIVVSADK